MDVTKLPQPLIVALAATQLDMINYSARDTDKLPLPDGSGVTALSSALALLHRQPYSTSWTIPEHLMFQAVLRSYATTALEPVAGTDHLVKAMPAPVPQLTFADGIPALFAPQTLPAPRPSPFDKPRDGEIPF